MDMLNTELECYLDELEKDPDIKYMKGVTPATLFRFINGSVHLDNIRKTVDNSVLTEFESLKNCELLLPFFADIRYRGIGLKTDAFKKSLLGNYLKLYYPKHLKVNMYHDEFIAKQIVAVEKCILLCCSSPSVNDMPVADHCEQESGSYSFFPTVKGFFSDNEQQCQKIMSDLKKKGMDSLYGVNHEMIDALMHCIRTGINHVLSLSDARSQPKRVLEYALTLYKECQNDAKTFADNFDFGIYNETRKVLEKKIAFDTVFLYLLLSELRSILPEGHLLCRKGWLSPVRPTIFYLEHRFSMHSNIVLMLQKKIVLKCILFSTLNRLKKGHDEEYGYMDLLSDIGSNFGWLDTKESRRDKMVLSILSQDEDCRSLTYVLFCARTPVAKC